MQIVDWREAYGTKIPDEHEKITWAYWDTQTYTSGSTTRLVFFGAVPANKLTGNLPLAGQLPSDQWFATFNIRFVPNADSLQFTAEAVNADPSTLGDALFDTELLINSGFLVFRIQNKDYGEWPLYMLPAGGGLWGNATLASGATAATFGALTLANNGVPDPRSVYSLSVPVVIPPQTNFQVIAEWPTAVTLRGGNPGVRVVLDGELIRPKQ